MERADAQVTRSAHKSRGNKNSGIADSHNSGSINILPYAHLYSIQVEHPGKPMQPVRVPSYSVAKHSDSKTSGDNILHLDIFVTSGSGKNIINYFDVLRMERACTTAGRLTYHRTNSA